MNPAWQFWSTAVLGMLIDLTTKSLVFRWLGYTTGNSKTLIPGFLDFRCATNSGGVFGILQGNGIIFVPLSFLALGVVYWFYIQIRRHAFRVVMPLGMISAGTLGNLYDRLVHGAVRDFIDVHAGRHYWPTFNVADSLICTGSALLILFMLTNPEAFRNVGGEKSDEDKAQENNETIGK